MQGKIVKGISGFYYVHVVESGIYECKAKGIFRQQKMKPLVGDDVEIDIISEEKKTGNVAAILPRKNALIRPAVANVDQALLIFAAASPNPNFNLLDRFLVMMGRQDVPAILCFNKCDLITEEQQQEIASIYEASGCKILFVSAKKELGLKELQKILEGKTTTVAGPSGVGKSSLINLLAPEACMETGEISKKIERGRHTTRHAELIQLKGDGYIMDTPGFSSLVIENLEPEDLKEYFREFECYNGRCKFNGCVHIHEPECFVKEALQAGTISQLRYDNYVQLYDELKNKRRW